MKIWIVYKKVHTDHFNIQRCARYGFIQKMLIFYLTKVQKKFTEVIFFGAIMPAIQNVRRTSAGFGLKGSICCSVYQEDRRTTINSLYGGTYYEELEENDGPSHGVSGCIYGQLHGICGSCWPPMNLVYVQILSGGISDEEIHEGTDEIHGAVR